MRKVEEQRKLLAREDPPHTPTCTGAFSQSQGLPCAHILSDLLTQNQVLRLEHFHSHWHLNRNGTPQLLLEPRQRIDPITVNSTIPQSSTQRELSGFELVQVTAKPRGPDKCSKCHNEGHRMNSRACPMRYAELQAQPALSTEGAVQETAPKIPPIQAPAEVLPSPPSPILTPVLYCGGSPGSHGRMGLMGLSQRAGLSRARVALRSSAPG